MTFLSLKKMCGRTQDPNIVYKNNSIRDYSANPVNYVTRSSSYRIVPFYLGLSSVQRDSSLYRPMIPFQSSYVNPNSSTEVILIENLQPSYHVIKEQEKNYFEELESLIGVELEEILEGQYAQFE